MPSRQMHEVRQSLRRIVPPSSTPVSLEEVKRALDLGDDTDSDVEIADLIPSAVEMVESDARVALVRQSLRLTLDRFPREIELWRPPVISVESVKYIDSGGDEQTLDPSDYAVDLSGAPGRIRPAYGASWPSTRMVMNAVTVEFTAGYPGGVRKVAKLAVLLAVKALYFGCEPGEAYWSLIERLGWGPR